MTMQDDIKLPAPHIDQALLLEAADHLSEDGHCMDWGRAEAVAAWMRKMAGAERAKRDAEKGTGIYHPDNQSIEARARQLVADAAAAGQVVRIDLVPRQPPAMGNFDMVVDVRPARHGVPAHLDWNEHRHGTGAAT